MRNAYQHFNIFTHGCWTESPLAFRFLIFFNLGPFATKRATRSTCCNNFSKLSQFVDLVDIMMMLNEAINNFNNATEPKRKIVWKSLLTIEFSMGFCWSLIHYFQRFTANQQEMQIITCETLGSHSFTVKLSSLCCCQWCVHVPSCGNAYSFVPTLKRTLSYTRTYYVYTVVKTHIHRKLKPHC